MTALLFLPAIAPFFGFAILLGLSLFGRERIQRWVSIIFALILVTISFKALGLATPVQGTLFTWSTLATDHLTISFSQRLDDLSRFFQLLPPVLALSVIVFVNSPSFRRFNRTTQRPWSFSEDGAIAPMERVGQGAPLGQRSPGVVCGLIFLLLGLAQTVIMSNNLVLLYVVWELMQFTVTMLVAISDRHGMRDDESIARLILPHAGGLLLLASIMITGTANGTFDMASIGSGSVSTGSLYLVLAVVLSRLSIFGLLGRSNPAVAVSPLFTLLNSGLLGWVGLYVLARWMQMAGINAGQQWRLAVALVALALILLGALRAVRQIRIDGMLQSVAIVQLGLAILGVSMGSAPGVAGSLMLAFCSVLLLTTLMLTGNELHVALGTQAMAEMRGLVSIRPSSAGLFNSGVALLAGLPFFSGNFFGLWLVLDGTWHGWYVIFAVFSVIAIALSFAAMIRAGFSMFLGRSLEIGSMASGMQLQLTSPSPDEAEHPEHPVDESTTVIPSGPSGEPSREMTTASSNLFQLTACALPFAVAGLIGLLPWLPYRYLIHPASGLISPTSDQGQSLLSVLAQSEGQLTFYLLPALIILSLCAGFLLYYRGDERMAAAKNKRLSKTDWRPEDSRMAWEQGIVQVRSLGVIAGLGRVALEAALSLASWLEGIMATVESHYYVVAVLLASIVVLFTLLE